MSHSKEPVTEVSSDQIMLDYFSNLSSNNQDSNNLENNSPQIIINNSDELQHPLSKKPIISTPPFLSQYLSPNSILKSVSSLGSTNKHIPHETSNRDRRPSAVTFQTDSVFFDAVSDLGETQPNSQRNDSNKNLFTLSKKIKNKTRRPSILSRISSAYTNKTATIPIDHVDFKKGHYLHESVVLCAVVSKNQIKLEQNYQSDKKLLKWKQYKAVITITGCLELYKICNCEKSVFLMCFHYRHKKPKYTIDLCPAVNNLLFQKAVLATKDKRNKEAPYFLSLLSNIDFSWSLSSPNSIFYFQSRSVHVSQQWYRSLYTCLPSTSKKSFPKTVNLAIPELSTSIQIPLCELIHEEDENVELSKVLESALVLLNRNGTRPANWSKRTLGLCWRSYFDDKIEWAIKPEDDNVEYLIEPRLIEKTHELQLRFYKKDTPPIQETPAVVEGYIMDASKSRMICKSNKLLYAITVDHYLFLYENRLRPTTRPFESLFCFPGSKRLNNQTFPNLPPPKFRTPRSAVGVIDLLRIKDIADITCDTYDEQDEPEHMLYLDEDYLFQILNQPDNDWSTGLKTIQHFYARTQISDEILLSSTFYVKPADSKYATFEKRLCILAYNGDFCIFKTKHNSYEVPEFSLSLKDDVYIHSGKASCRYISGLPSHQPARMFENGEIIENHGENKPNQCCFVIHGRGKQYVLLAKTQAQKDNWVRAICSFL